MRVVIIMNPGGLTAGATSIAVEGGTATEVEQLTKTAGEVLVRLIEARKAARS